MCKNNFTNENEFDFCGVIPWCPPWDDPSNPWWLHPAPEPYPYNPYGPHIN
jgi:hypothetical protein